jgi:hypothetical protein
LSVAQASQLLPHNAVRHRKRLVFLWVLLGYDLRNQAVFDVTEEGKIIFRENLTLSDDDWQKITTLKSYINTLDKI